MCNEAARRIALGLIREDFSQRRIPLRFPEGLPNLAATDSVRITDRTLVVRAAPDASGEADAVQRRWSWPGPSGRPVYNYRSDGRRLDGGRCLIPVDGFYEFTAATDPKAKRKNKWLFEKIGEPWFAIAGVWRDDPAVGEAFAMLTTAPGPDIAPYHDRQVVIVERDDWAGWLDGSRAADAVCRPAPAGTLSVKAVPTSTKGH